MGRHNISNLLGVIGAALKLGLSLETIQNAVLKFEGIKRRQDILGIFRGVTLIDDFAHHPTAVSETLLAIRGRYPTQRIWAVFEPRSNTTRRKVFQKEFVSSFREADQVIVAAPFMPEKIPEADRLEPEALVASMIQTGLSARYIPEVESIVETIIRESKEGDVICLMSNGGFGGIYQKLIQALS